jgi:predicted deacylase
VRNMGLVDPQAFVAAGVRATRGKAVHGRIWVADVPESYHPWTTLVGGTQPGPVVAVVAGVHGAEVSSIEAARRLASYLPGRLARGVVVVVPVANMAAFLGRTLYVNPLDGKNLNRVFPGRPGGSPSERLAYALMEGVVRPAHVVLDLHGGDLVEALDPFMLAESPNEVPNHPALELAEAFALDQVVAAHVPGSLAAAATEMGKASLLAECGQQGILSPRAVTRLVDGVLRVLRFLGMLEESAAKDLPRLGRPVYRPGWTWMNAEHTGYWYPAPGVMVGREVTQGTPLGTIHPLDPHDRVVEVVSPHDGRVLFLVTALSAVRGSPLCAVARPACPWPSSHATVGEEGPSHLQDMPDSI